MSVNVLLLQKLDLPSKKNSSGQLCIAAKHHRPMKLKFKKKIICCFNLDDHPQSGMLYNFYRVCWKITFSKALT